MRMSMRGLQTASPEARSRYADSSALRTAAGVSTRRTTSLSMSRVTGATPLLFGVVVIFLEMPGHESCAFGCGLLRPRNHRLLKHQVQEKHHGLGLEHQCARRLHRV